MLVQGVYSTYVVLRHIHDVLSGGGLFLVVHLIFGRRMAVVPIGDREQALYNAGLAVGHDEGVAKCSDITSKLLGSVPGPYSNWVSVVAVVYCLIIALYIVTCIRNWGVVGTAIVLCDALSVVVAVVTFPVVVWPVPRMVALCRGYGTEKFWARFLYMFFASRYGWIVFALLCTATVVNLWWWWTHVEDVPAEIARFANTTFSPDNATHIAQVVGRDSVKGYFFPFFSAVAALTPVCHMAIGSRVWISRRERVHKYVEQHAADIRSLALDSAEYTEYVERAKIQLREQFGLKHDRDD